MTFELWWQGLSAILMQTSPGMCEKLPAWSHEQPAPTHWRSPFTLRRSITTREDRGTTCLEASLRKPKHGSWSFTIYMPEWVNLKRSAEICCFTASCPTWFSVEKTAIQVMLLLCRGKNIWGQIHALAFSCSTHAFEDTLIMGNIRVSWR